MSKLTNSILEGLSSSRMVNEGTMSVNTSYFTFTIDGEEVRMSDLNGNYTSLYKEDVKELIKALKHVESKLK